MSIEINIGDKFECIRLGETKWSIFEVKNTSHGWQYKVEWDDGLTGGWGIDALKNAISIGSVRRVEKCSSAVRPAAAQPTADSKIKFEVGQVYAWDEQSRNVNTFKITSIDAAGLHTECIHGRATEPHPISPATAQHLVETNWWRLIEPGPSGARHVGAQPVATQPAWSTVVDGIKLEAGQVYAWGATDRQRENQRLRIERVVPDCITYIVEHKGAGTCEAKTDDAISLIRRGYWRLINPSPSGDGVAQTTTRAEVATFDAIHGTLPDDLRKLPLMDAIRQLVQVYVARKCDSDSATTVQELRTLVDRMRRERIANVLPPKEEIMSDNEYTEPSP